MLDAVAKFFSDRVFGPDRRSILEADLAGIDDHPETREAGVTDAINLWRQDCPLFGVGTFARRPTVTTPDPALALAGDGIRIDLPVALMERAAATGWTAANALLRHWGITGHPIRSVPNRGRIGVLNRLARSRYFGGVKV